MFQFGMRVWAPARQVGSGEAGWERSLDLSSRTLSTNVDAIQMSTFFNGADCLLSNVTRLKRSNLIKLTQSIVCATAPHWC